MTFFSPQKKEGSALVIFLSSGQIEAEYFSNSLKSKKNIFFVKENFKLAPNMDPKTLEDETFLALKKVLHKLFQISSSGKPSKIFFVFGAPWYISTAINIDLKRNKTFFVEKEEIVKELESKSLENNANFAVIESRIISIIANGYEIKDLKGKRAKHVSAKAILNIAEKRILKKIEIETARYFPGTKIKVHTLPSISTKEISETVGDNNFLLVLSEDEITEICFVKDKQVTESISVPFGRNYFLRILVEINLAPDLDSADSILKMYNEGHLDREKKEVLEEIMKEASRRCQKFLRKALFKYFDKDRHLESVVILSSSKDINLILKNIFADYYIGQTTKNDFVKLLHSKNPEQSSLFSSATSGIKNLYF